MPIFPSIPSIVSHVNLTLAAAPARGFGYDDNGSLTSTMVDGQPEFACEWDAANRLSAIVKNGARTEFTYDGLSRWVRIVEKGGTTTAAPVTGERRIVWEGYGIAQIRDAISGEVRNIFGEGEQRIAGQTLLLLAIRDHLGSVRELVNVGDLAMRARYDFDPYGQRTKLGGDLDSDFGFTGHYEHLPTGLTLAPFRAYSAPLGRWLSRDPIGEEGGLNLYGYVSDNPINNYDVFGFDESMAPGSDAMFNSFLGEATKTRIGDLPHARAAARRAAQIPIEVRNDVAIEIGMAVIPWGRVLEVVGKGAYTVGNLTKWGWVGSKGFGRALAIVKKGGSIENIAGHVPTFEEAVQLLQSAKCKLTRVSRSGHTPPNTEIWPHINFETESGIKGGLQVTDIPSNLPSDFIDKFSK